MTRSMRLRCAACAAAFVSLITLGCAHRADPKPKATLTWYVGSLGDYDYFHQGPTPNDGTNYRLPRGQLDLGDPFPLTVEPARWRRIEIQPPTTNPATTAPTSSTGAAATGSTGR